MSATLQEVQKMVSVPPGFQTPFHNTLHHWLNAVNQQQATIISNFLLQATTSKIHATRC